MYSGHPCQSVWRTVFDVVLLYAVILLSNRGLNEHTQVTSWYTPATPEVLQVAWLSHVARATKRYDINGRCDATCYVLRVT